MEFSYHVHIKYIQSRTETRRQCRTKLTYGQLKMKDRKRNKTNQLCLIQKYEHAFHCFKIVGKIINTHIKNDKDLLVDCAEFCQPCVIKRLIVGRKTECNTAQ